MSVHHASSNPLSHLAHRNGEEAPEVRQIHAFPTNVDEEGEAHASEGGEPVSFDKFAYVKERILDSASHLTYRERMVLLVLWSYASGNGRSAFPTRATIVLAAGIGKGKHGEVTKSDQDKVTAILKKLRSKRYIRMTKDRSSTGKRSNIYALVM